MFVTVGFRGFDEEEDIFVVDFIFFFFFSFNERWVWVLGVFFIYFVNECFGGKFVFGGI